MKNFISNIIEEARRAPSVLNSQPWRLRVCGNTIEVYLEKRPALEPVDPKGRLQVASCGTLIAHLENAILARGLHPKVTYFPRFEEENLVAFVETSSTGEVKNTNRPAVSGVTDWHARNDAYTYIQDELSGMASRKDIGLIIHDDSADRKIQTYLRNKCGEKLKSENFRKTLNLFLRPDSSDASIPFEDEVLMSDRFFETGLSDGKSAAITDSESVENVFMILTTGSDNRFDWTRAGEVLGNIIIQLRHRDQTGLMALPIISNDCCREWLKKQLKLSGYPQFVLRMQPDKPREHMRKRPLKEVLKYGF